MLDEVITQRGKPVGIRCDNGPELTSRHMLAWAMGWKIELRHIQPGDLTPYFAQLCVRDHIVDLVSRGCRSGWSVAEA